MPYNYKHHYETVDDIKKEFSDVYNHPRRLGGTFNEIKEKRIYAAKQRQTFLETLEFEDQMQDRIISLNVDLRNKYSIMSAIDMLNGALARLEQENFEVPYDPTGYYG